MPMYFVYGSFRKLAYLIFGVPIIRILLFRNFQDLGSVAVVQHVAQGSPGLNMGLVRVIGLVVYQGPKKHISISIL